MIVGAQKAGTTSISRLLDQHPDIKGHDRLEFGYFVSDEEYKWGYDKALQFYFGENDFKSVDVLLAKNAGIHSKIHSMERLHQHNPDVKIIFSIRHPVLRAYSSFQMEQRAGNILNRQFEEFVRELAKEDHGQQPGAGYYRILLYKSMYIYNLYELEKRFPRENIKVLFLEDFKQNPLQELNKLCEFLGVSGYKELPKKVAHNTAGVPKNQGFVKALRAGSSSNSPIRWLLTNTIGRDNAHRLKNWLISQNTSDQKPEPISESAYKFLEEYYEPCNALLSEHLGFDVTLKWERPKHLLKTPKA